MPVQRPFAEPLKNGVNFTKEQVGTGQVCNVGDLFVPKYINADSLERVEISNKN